MPFLKSNNVNIKDFTYHMLSLERKYVIIYNNVINTGFVDYDYKKEIDYVINNFNELPKILKKTR